MKINRSTRLFVLCAGLAGFSLNAAAAETLGLYTNGQWDSACASCWPEPRTAANNHCTPKDCAIQGFYHCKMQHPRLAIDDDPRLISLIKSGDCTYASKSSMSKDELQYVEGLKVCETVLDKMAGRFTLPANAKDASRMKGDFYLTTFKAYILGSAHDQLKLAINYDIGQGTKQNREKATQLYDKAAHKGSPFAQYAISARYAYGIGAPQNSEKALEWLDQIFKNKPHTVADKKAQAVVEPCAIKLMERLTPS